MGHPAHNIRLSNLLIKNLLETSISDVKLLFVCLFLKLIFPYLCSVCNVTSHSFSNFLQAIDSRLQLDLPTKSSISDVKLL